MTFEKRVTWTSHLVRRSVFMLLLPFAGMASALSSAGPPTHYLVPTLCAGAIGFLSNLAVAECHGLTMETYDTSDLPLDVSGGRSGLTTVDGSERRRSSHSCYPRVSAGIAVIQTLSFLLAAASTAVGGKVERRIGAQAATGVVAGILLVLTLALVAVLWRWKVVPVIPSSAISLPRMQGDDNDDDRPDSWQPVIIGSPSGRTRRMNILELGQLSRWTEIRRLNRLTVG